jgi:hypothetical protein
MHFLTSNSAVVMANTGADTIPYNVASITWIISSARKVTVVNHFASVELQFVHFWRVIWLSDNALLSALLWVNFQRWMRDGIHTRYCVVPSLSYQLDVRYFRLFLPFSTDMVFSRAEQVHGMQMNFYIFVLRY